MITRVALENWRAFETLELPLSAPVVFIVAANGVGKTSIVSGARWALFGDAAGIDPREEMRGDGGCAASVDLRLADGSDLSVTRTQGKRGRATVAASLSGAPVEGEAGVNHALEQALRGDVPLLSRLCMLGEQDLRNAPSDGDVLHKHLASVFGVDNLQAAAAQAAAVARTAARTTREVRSVARLAETERESLQEQLHAVDESLRQLGEEQRAVSQQLADLRSDIDVWLAHERYEAALTDRGRELASAAAAAAAVLGRDVAPEELGAALDAEERRLIAQSDEARQHIMRLDARIEAASEAFEQLQESHGDCPVCLRPLDEHTSEGARTRHEALLAQLREERAASNDADRAGAALGQVRDLQQRVRRIAQPVAAPSAARPASDLQQLQIEEPRLRAAIEQTVASVAAATEHRRLLLAQLNEDEEARAARTTLVSAYRREAFARAAEQALSATADEVIANSIGPLEDALRQRWKLLMGGAGVLSLHQGQTRLERGEGSLHLAQLSGAERAIATLLTRMLILVGSTRARFLWLDEPLEHLDPKNRRAVASTLVRIVERGEIEQIVVTTYEEKLARRLASRSNVAEVVYVRSSE